MRRAWRDAATPPRIAAIASATPVAYSRRRFTTRTVASWSSIGVDRRSTSPEKSGTATSPNGRPRRSTRPRDTWDVRAVSSATVSLLIDPARDDESASGRSETGFGPKTWYTTTRASERNDSPMTNRSNASGSLKSVLGVGVRGRHRLALEVVEPLVDEAPLERRHDHQIRAAERAGHDREQRDRDRGPDTARESHPTDTAPSRNRYPAPRTVRMSSGSPESRSIFSRRWRTWTSIVLGSR